MRVQVFSAVCAALLCIGVPGYAQPAAGVSGQLLNSLSGAPIPGAVVVIEELRRGYKLGDRLLRPAMVKVAKA